MTPARRFAWGDVTVALARTATLAPDHATDCDYAEVRGQPLVPRRERLAARSLLRTIVGEVDANAAAAPLRAAASGKPFLFGHPEVPVSLSHSEGWIAAAVARSGRIGVDVQVPTLPSPGLLRRCLQAHDFEQIRGLEPNLQAEHLARVWSVQEACVKATGAGFRGRPWSIDVELHERSGGFDGLVWAVLLTPGPVALSIAAGQENYS